MLETIRTLCQARDAYLLTLELMDNDGSYAQVQQILAALLVNIELFKTTLSHRDAEYATRWEHPRITRLYLPNGTLGFVFELRPSIFIHV